MNWDLIMNIFSFIWGLLYGGIIVAVLKKGDEDWGLFGFLTFIMIGSWIYLVFFSL